MAEIPNLYLTKKKRIQMFNLQLHDNVFSSKAYCSMQKREIV